MLGVTGGKSAGGHVRAAPQDGCPAVPLADFHSYFGPDSTRATMSTSIACLLAGESHASIAMHRSLFR
eukprot:2422230-Rhodomonas_salina.2